MVPSVHDRDLGLVCRRRCRLVPRRLPQRCLQLRWASGLWFSTERGILLIGFSTGRALFRIRWIVSFLRGQLPGTVDRHALKDPSKVAIIWESDEPGQSVSITYGELLKQVSLAANMLKSLGVKKGDTVIIYLPMVPEALYSMLACARIGAVHRFVFYKRLVSRFHSSVANIRAFPQCRVCRLLVRGPA